MLQLTQSLYILSAPHFIRPILSLSPHGTSVLQWAYSVVSTHAENPLSLPILLHLLRKAIYPEF